MNTLGDRVRFLRGERSQAEFSALLEVSQSFLSGVERNLQTPGGDFLRSLKRLTGQSADWLLDGEANSEATQPSPQHIPLFLTPVPAGAPTPGDDHVETWFSCQNVIPHPENSFACRVTGDSMIGAGIEAGDILIVEKREAQEEDIAIVSINSELTVKRIRSINGVTYLYPENERYKATAVSEEDSLTVWGVVIHSIKPH